jgi:hypothetical protein
MSTAGESAVAAAQNYPRALHSIKTPVLFPFSSSVQHASIHANFFWATDLNKNFDWSLTCINKQQVIMLRTSYLRELHRQGKNLE